MDLIYTFVLVALGAYFVLRAIVHGESLDLKEQELDDRQYLERRILEEKDKLAQLHARGILSKEDYEDALKYLELQLLMLRRSK